MKVPMTTTLDQRLDGANWRTSSLSGNNGQCVQVAFLPVPANRQSDPETEGGESEGGESEGADRWDGESPNSR